MNEPLTPEEYKAWRANVHGIAAMLLPEAPSPGLDEHEITTTVEMQLRLFATIEARDTTIATLRELREREGR